MANLNIIRDRISSINNTKKITRAMKMVAAAKVKKSENRVKGARPYSNELAELFYKTLGSIKDLADEHIKVEDAIDNYPILISKRDVKSVGLLVVTSNKGLAGAFNANVIRYTSRKIEEYKSQGISCKLFVVGQKGLNALKRGAKDGKYEILQTYTKFAQDPTPAAARIVAEDMAETFVKGQIDSIDIITTRFKNMMSYSVEEWSILPFKEEESKGGINLEMDFEPDLGSILKKIVPLFISNTIYQAFLESTASELAARMTAMSAACNNAEEMIRILTIDYNKARQAAITQEITEVVSGADPLK